MKIARQDVRRDHDVAPVLDALEPDTGRHREQQVRQQRHRGQQAHVLRVRVEDEDRDERHCEQRELVADDGDRLADPERAERGRPEQGRHEPPGQDADCSGPRP
jgi:hypothetical protein